MKKYQSKSVSNSSKYRVPYLVFDVFTLRSKFTFFLVFLVIISLIPIWVVKYLPLLDYSNHLLVATIIKNIDNPDFDFSQNFKLDWSLNPYLFFYIFCFLAMKFFSPWIAGKIFLSLYVILFIICFYFFLLSLDSDKKWLIIIASPLIYNCFFYAGFLNYLISIPVFFLGIGIVNKLIKEKTKKLLLLATILSYLVYLTHVITFLFFILVVLISLFLHFRSFRKAFSTAVFLIPSILLCVYWISSNIIFSSNSFQYPQSKFVFGSLINKLHTLVGWMDCYCSKSRYIFITIPLIFFVLLLLQYWKKLKSLKANKGFKLDFRNNKYEILFLVLLIIYFILPFSIRKVHISSRLVVFLFLIGIANLDSNLINRRLTQFLMVAFYIMFISVVTAHHIRFDREMKSFDNIIEFMDHNKKVLPLTFDWSSRDFKFVHAHTVSYYHIRKGGANPFIFAIYPHIPLNFKKKMLPLPFGWNPNNFKWIKYGSMYDYFLVKGENRQILNELHTHSRLKIRDGTWYLFENKHCSDKNAIQK